MVKHIRSFYLNKYYFLGIKIISSVNNIFDLACQVTLEVKNLLGNAGDTRDIGSIPLSRRSPEGEHGYPLQYFCLENSVDRRVWWAHTHTHLVMVYHRIFSIVPCAVQ